MQYSVVNKNELVSDTRLDAEAYLPLFFEIEKEIRKHDFTTLDQESSLFVKGIFDIKADCYLENGGIPFVRIGDLRDMVISENEIIYIPEEENNKNKKTFLKRGDIILSKTAYPAASFVNLENCNTSQDTIAIKLKTNSKIKSQYLVLFLNSKFGFLQMKRWFTGNIQMHLNLTDSKKIEMPIFSDNFQKKLQNLFQESINKIGHSKSLYSQAEQLLLSELGLLDWKPKHELAFVRNFSNTIESNRFDAEYFQPKYEEIVDAVKRYGNLPASAKATAGKFDELGNLVKIKKSVEPGSEAYQENGIPFVRVSNLSKFELSDNNQQFISEKLYEELKTHQPKKGEILLSKDATPGMAYYLNEETQRMIVSGGILRLKMDSRQMLPEYLTLVLNSVIVQKQIERDAGGSIINHWRPDQVKATIIPVLQEAKQKEIKELVEKSFNDRRLSKSLLEIAKQGVEMAIEKDEQEAEKWIDGEVTKLEIKK